jgi:hypothetical protein
MTGNCGRLQPTLLCPVLSVAFFLAGILTSLTDTLAGDHPAPLADGTGSDVVSLSIPGATCGIDSTTARLAMDAGDRRSQLAPNTDTRCDPVEITFAVSHQLPCMIRSIVAITSASTSTAGRLASM